MSLSSKSDSPHSFSSPHTEARQSPNTFFEVPLFPGYVKPTAKTRPTYVSDRPTPQPTPRPTDDTSAQHASEELHKLRSKLYSLEQRHNVELRQLEATWQSRLDAAITLPQSNPRSNPRSNPQLDALTQRSKGPVFPTPAFPTPLGNQGRPSLRHVPTTYQLPVFRINAFDRVLGSVPTFFVWVVAGIALAGLSAIALSPTVLWPSLSIVIQTIIPYIFVAGLCSLFVTAVWNSGR
ncbi:MAG: hypothetical protein AAFY72_06605 [Cyanobacteria bacterium J06649_4]